MPLRTSKIVTPVLSGMEIERFRSDLLGWFAAHQRDLPWRRTRDPYAIWISEIMLQQTRVSAVIPYYERFLARFPNIRVLAEAPEAELLACWAGLGYYHRARNLQQAAQQMRDVGSFPAAYDAIRRLPGVGDYTAAAVASIGFGLPHAVVDGNVFRVLSRIFDDPTNIASGDGRKHFGTIAQQLLDREQPGTFNQAMMELGATICLPTSPQCLLCPVSSFCKARQTGHQNELPVKALIRKSVEEKRFVFWIERDGKLLVWQRPSTSRLMPGFWELPERTQLSGVVQGRQLGSFRHGITFHRYLFTICEADPPSELGECQWASFDGLSARPVSTILKKAKRVVDRARKTFEAERSVAAGT